MGLYKNPVPICLTRNQCYFCFSYLFPSFEHTNTIESQGHLQVSENKRIHVNGCPRMGVIIFLPLIVFQLKPTVYMFAVRLDIILWHGVIIQYHY